MSEGRAAAEVDDATQEWSSDAPDWCARRGDHASSSFTAASCRQLPSAAVSCGQLLPPLAAAACSSFLHSHSAHSVACAHYRLLPSSLLRSDPPEATGVAPLSPPPSALRGASDASWPMPSLYLYSPPRGASSPGFP